jgi:hypothetical protein
MLATPRDIAPIEPEGPRQPLSREEFARALALHGFEPLPTAVGLQFVDRRRGRQVAATIDGRAADGRSYLDRLATLRELLALRRAGDELAAQRRSLWRRLRGWLAPASVARALTPASFERHPQPRR